MEAGIVAREKEQGLRGAESGPQPRFPFTSSTFSCIICSDNFEKCGKNMIEFDEYKVKLNNIRPKLDALADSLGIEAAKEEIDRLHAQIESDGFWDNQRAFRRRS